MKIARKRREMSASLAGLIPEFRPWAKRLLLSAGQAGLQPRVTSTRRSHREQSWLYKRYLAGQNPFPVAPPGTSAHEFGFAMDMVTVPFDALSDLGSLWISWGGLWGASDPVHFEFPGFPHTRAARGFRIPSVVKTAAEFLTPTVLTTAPRAPGYETLASEIERLLER